MSSKSLLDYSSGSNIVIDMIALISPAKTLDFNPSNLHSVCTQPEFLNLSKDLISGLSNLSSNDLSELMSLSPKLAELNQDRFNQWKIKHDQENSKQAVLAFKGDVYEGLQAWEFNQKDFTFAQKHLRVLSGLYGLLRPLDLIQPYRLEMGTVYANPKGRDLYHFWGDALSMAINEDLKNIKSQLLINLASQEYFKAAKEKNIKAEIISPAFLDEKNGKYKIISFYAKKARGYMANYLIKNQIKNYEDLLKFDAFGYKYSNADSTDSKPVFTRSENIRSAA